MLTNTSVRRHQAPSVMVRQRERKDMAPDQVGTSYQRHCAIFNRLVALWSKLLLVFRLQGRMQLKFRRLAIVCCDSTASHHFF